MCFVAATSSTACSKSLFSSTHVLCCHPRAHFSLQQREYFEQFSRGIFQCACQQQPVCLWENSRVSLQRVNVRHVRHVRHAPWKSILHRCSNYPRSTYSASVFAHLQGQPLLLSTLCTWRTNCTVLSAGFHALVSVHFQKLGTVQSRPGAPVFAHLVRHRHFCEHTMPTLHGCLDLSLPILSPPTKVSMLSKHRALNCGRSPAGCACGASCVCCCCCCNWCCCNRLQGLTECDVQLEALSDSPRPRCTTHFLEPRWESTQHDHRRFQVYKWTGICLSVMECSCVI